MRAVIAALALAVPLASCEEAAPTFGDGGWGGGDIEEAVALGDESAPRPPSPPVERPRERPEPAEPEPEDDEEEEALVEAPAVTPEPVVSTPSAPSPVEPAAPPAPEPTDDKPPEA